MLPFRFFVPLSLGGSSFQNGGNISQLSPPNITSAETACLLFPIFVAREAFKTGPGLGGFLGQQGCIVTVRVFDDIAEKPRIGLGLVCRRSKLH